MAKKSIRIEETFEGEVYHTLKDLAEASGVLYNTLKKRYRVGKRGTALTASTRRARSSYDTIHGHKTKEEICMDTGWSIHQIESLLGKGLDPYEVHQARIEGRKALGVFNGVVCYTFYQMEEVTGIHRRTLQCRWLNGDRGDYLIRPPHATTC